MTPPLDLDGEGEEVGSSALSWRIKKNVSAEADTFSINKQVFKSLNSHKLALAKKGIAVLALLKLLNSVLQR
jgi:hypothetical protein